MQRKARRQAVRRGPRRKELGETERPALGKSNVKSLAAVEAERMARLKAKIVEHPDASRGISAVEFLMHPTSFSQARAPARTRARRDCHGSRVYPQSVENVFDLAFLVKQGFGSVSVDAAGVPRLTDRVPNPTDKEAQRTHQAVVSFSYDQWEVRARAVPRSTRLPRRRRRRRRLTRVPRPSFGRSGTRNAASDTARGPRLRATRTRRT